MYCKVTLRSNEDEHVLDGSSYETKVHEGFTSFNLSGVSSAQATRVIYSTTGHQGEPKDCVFAFEDKDHPGLFTLQFPLHLFKIQG